MAVNKIDYCGETLIDLTADTVTADRLLSGYTAHGADGSLITGRMEAGGGDNDSRRLSPIYVLEGLQPYYSLLRAHSSSKLFIYKLESGFSCSYITRQTTGTVYFAVGKNLVTEAGGDFDGTAQQTNYRNVEASTSTRYLYVSITGDDPYEPVVTQQATIRKYSDYI